MNWATLVIDIGMTNKKVAVYDENLRQLDVSYKNFPPVPYVLDTPDLGRLELETHDLPGMKTWFFAELKKFGAKYPVKAISVTTHGATFVCIGKDGAVSAPCIFYTYEPGPEFQTAFYNLAGDRDALQKTTYTPPLSAMINPAKGIFFLQKYMPREFARTETLLFYPQYWSYLLTGVAGIEPTSVGCHTYLWNHAKTEYSAVTDKLNIRHLLPANYRNSYETLGTLSAEAAALTGLPPSTIVTMGIHDSNASLLPYLAKDDSTDFILNSTGTWCVVMHPQENLDFKAGDIGNVVFFNQSALRKPVKTAIFLGGMEFDTYISLYKKINARDDFPPDKPEIFQKLLEDNDTYLLPEILPGSGQFNKSRPGILEKGRFYPLAAIAAAADAGLAADAGPAADADAAAETVPPVMRDAARFYALLDVSLVIQTLFALQRAGLKAGTRVFTEGGFRVNPGYKRALAAALPENELYLTNLSEATSAGAAMTAVMAYTGKTHKDIAGSVNIEYTAVKAETFAAAVWERYKASWLEAVEQEKR